MSTTTTELRLRVAQIIGDLGAVISHLDTFDEIARNPSTPDRDSVPSREALNDAHMAADVATGHCDELTAALGRFPNKSARRQPAPAGHVFTLEPLRKGPASLGPKGVH